MADSKITALTALTAADPVNDMFPVVDVSDTSMAASGTTKKISVNNILGASGTATLASATITGDLTVDTSTLKVDSTLNRVGILTASPSNTFQVGDGSADSRAFFFSNNDFSLAVGRSNAAIGGYIGSPAANVMVFSSGAGVEQYRITAPGIFSWSDGAGGTRMTLNSTGLGVGASPANVITARAAQDTGLELNSAASNASRLIFAYDPANTRWYINSTLSGSGTTLPLAFLIGNTERMRIDTSGNVGIGVTPSAWAVSYKSIEVGAIGSFANDPTNVSVGANRFFNGTNSIYKTTAAASVYNQTAGTHAWYTAPSGTAGNAITFTQAMTLDASGNLLVGKTATGFGTVGNEVKANGEVFSTQASTSNVASTYHVYSTGAAAYRFYVGMAGTVFATNTTISAISDARLKENVQDIDVGLGAILALKPRKFDWKAGKGKDIKGDRGFIAQEFEQVFPQLVDEWADPAPEGEAPYKSVRQDLIPVLVKAIQELTARVQTLETR